MDFAIVRRFRTKRADFARRQSKRRAKTRAPFEAAPLADLGAPRGPRPDAYQFQPVIITATMYGAAASRRGVLVLPPMPSPPADPEAPSAPVYDESGIDREQIRRMLALSPEERLRRVQEFVESALAIRELNEKRQVR